ncbi:hypothetical protein [Chryseobacterium sp. RU37D]|uniref:hypothetical protein n=1 Tax=Chryseobacterium sp. RU37D TaxID=1907397 RepID=UPI001E59C32C|nr:hypothetical protein [Chryseobacterium sp. RU37D]
MSCDHNQKLKNHGDQKPLKTGRNPKGQKNKKANQNINHVNARISSRRLEKVSRSYLGRSKNIQRSNGRVCRSKIHSSQEVSTQLVNETNYRFRCIASMPPSQMVWEAIVEIYAPIEGRPHVTSIHRF